MKLRRLKTKNFRNLAAVDPVPGPGVNVIYGENAQGKTNLIEAVNYLSCLKSFRGAGEAQGVPRPGGEGDGGVHPHLPAGL